MKNPIKKFLTSFFGGMSDFDRMTAVSVVLISVLPTLHLFAIFLILSNVKIPSPLARVKMRRAELFSENGDSARIS